MSRSELPEASSGSCTDGQTWGGLELPDQETVVVPAVRSCISRFFSPRIVARAPEGRGL